MDEEEEVIEVQTLADVLGYTLEDAEEAYF